MSTYRNEQLPEHDIVYVSGWYTPSGKKINLEFEFGTKGKAWFTSGLCAADTHYQLKPRELERCFNSSRAWAPIEELNTVIVMIVNDVIDFMKSEVARKTDEYLDAASSAFSIKHELGRKL